MAKRVKPQTMHEAVALRLLRAARRLHLTYVTDEELLKGIRGKVPPLPPPPANPPKLTPEELQAFIQLLAQMAGARIPRQAPPVGAQGIPGQFPGGGGVYGGFPPFPGQIPPQNTSPAPRLVPWRVILGIPQDKPVTAADVHARWKLLTTVYHPDAGGSKEAFQAITDARDYAIRELGSK